MVAVVARDLRVSRKEEEAYFKAARSWDDDRVQSALKSRKVAWFVALCACAIAAILAIAIAALTPLKRVDAFLVRVDSSTGIVDNVVRVSDAKLSQDELMTRYFLRKYVVLRESYTRQQVQPNYEQLLLFTTPKLRTALKNEWHIKSPSSPYNRYGELGVADVKIKNVTFLSSNIGQVRYYVTERKSGVETQRHMIATMDFQYVATPASEEARAVNPLGFQVMNWRTDEEAMVGETGK